MKSCTCSCKGYVDRWGHDDGCPSGPKGGLALLCLLLLGTMALFFGVGFLILWIYASWGGGCIEAGGRIVGSGTETRCEGMRP